MPERIQRGDIAPDFSLPDQHGNPFHQAEPGRGRSGHVIYFHAKASAPGCTAQVCGLRDAAGSVGGTVIVDISPDSHKRLAACDQKYSLGFAPLSDIDHSVAEAYGVWVPRSMYGRS